MSVIVLAVPTLAMGGTLPAAARAVTRAGDVRRQHVATLYAANTLGAVAGCLVADVLPARDLRNARDAVAGRRAERARGDARARAGTADEHEAREAAGASEVTPDHRDLTPPHLPHPPYPPHLPSAAPPALFLLIASATVGFAFFLMELVWYRLLGPLLGGSVFTFGLVLAVALAGIGLGGLLYSLIGRDRPASLVGFAVCCLLEAAAVAATFALGDRMALLALALLPLGAVGFAAAIGGWTLVTAIVVLPPAIVAGYQFPMLIALFGQGRDHLGRDVGLAYAANTAGAIVGSLAGGFGLLPWLSAPGAWRLVAVVLVALGLAAAVLDVARAERARPASDSAFAAAVACAWISAASPLLLLAAAGPDGGLASQRHRRRPRAARSCSRRRTGFARGATPSAARLSGSATASKAASRSPPNRTATRSSSTASRTATRAATPARR